MRSPERIPITDKLAYDQTKGEINVLSDEKEGRTNDLIPLRGVLLAQPASAIRAH